MHRSNSLVLLHALEKHQWPNMALIIAVAQMLKNLPAVQENWVQPLGQEGPLQEGMATH